MPPTKTTNKKKTPTKKKEQNKNENVPKIKTTTTTTTSKNPATIASWCVVCGCCVDVAGGIVVTGDLQAQCNNQAQSKHTYLPLQALASSLAPLLSTQNPSTEKTANSSVIDWEGVKNFVTSLLHERLPQDLLYHGPDHTLKDVLPAAEKLAELCKIPYEDFICLRAAALFHDVGFIDQYQANEPRGCEWARRELPRFNYSQEQIEQIEKIIMATQLPQKPTTLLDKIICDADLSHLASLDYFYKTELLRKEIMIHSKQQISPIDWARGNVKFLEHEYWTEEARCHWGEGLALNQKRNEILAVDFSEQPKSALVDEKTTKDPTGKSN